MSLTNRLRRAAGDQRYPPFPEGIPGEMIQQGRYQVRFATRPEELDALLRLRYRVFNVELGEGLASSHANGRDEDPFDRQCHHLLVESSDHASVVGTYRMQTRVMATAARGFYSAAEFGVEILPTGVVDGAVEVGRACIAREHRNRSVLFLLWKGLARYMAANRKRYLFGCCSLNSRDPAVGARVEWQLERDGHRHPEIEVPVTPGLRCEAEPTGGVDVELPALFRTYLRYGAKICSSAAMDREFGTIDFLMLFDVEAMPRSSHSLFFG